MKRFRVDTFRAGGPGGQNQNSRETGVRITDSVTGIATSSRRHRTQLQNKRAAWAKMRLLTAELKRGVKERRTGGSVIRTYSEPRNSVKDYASGERFQYTSIMNDIGPALNARRKAMQRSAIWNA